MLPVLYINNILIVGHIHLVDLRGSHINALTLKHLCRQPLPTLLCWVCLWWRCWPPLVPWPPPEHLLHAIGYPDSWAWQRHPAEFHVSLDSLFNSTLAGPVFAELIPYSLRAQATEPPPPKAALDIVYVFLGAVLSEATAGAPHRLDVHLQCSWKLRPCEPADA